MRIAARHFFPFLFFGFYSVEIFLANWYFTMKNGANVRAICLFKEYSNNLLSKLLIRITWIHFLCAHTCMPVMSVQAQLSIDWKSACDSSTHSHAHTLKRELGAQTSFASSVFMEHIMFTIQFAYICGAYDETKPHKMVAGNYFKIIICINVIRVRIIELYILIAPSAP